MAKRVDNPATTIINIKVARLDNFVMNSANIGNEATDGRPMRWCIMAFVRGDSDEALQYAVDRNWVIRGEGSTACLTDEGRKLITRDFN